MKLAKIFLPLGFAALFIMPGCVKQDKHIDWKVMNDEWFAARNNEAASFPFVWTIDKLKNPMLHSAFKTTESGIKYRELRLGNPAGRMPNPTSRIWITYEGKMIDGTTFDSGTESDLGYLVNSISGFQEILLKMHIGDIYEMYIPWSLGYGEKGSYKIPPYSVLIFRVELTDAKY